MKKLKGGLGDRTWERAFPKARVSSSKLFPDGRQEPLRGIGRGEVRRHSLLHASTGECRYNYIGTLTKSLKIKMFSQC